MNYKNQIQWIRIPQLIDRLVEFNQVLKLELTQLGKRCVACYVAFRPANWSSLKVLG
jgi:hypothetical protein